MDPNFPAVKTGVFAVFMTLNDNLSHLADLLRNARICNFVFAREERNLNLIIM